MASVLPQLDSTSAHYGGDFAAWAFQQAMLLRAGQLHLLDRTYIAEELESLGHEQYDTLESALVRILQHMLKWDQQSGRRTRSWANSIVSHRKLARRQLDRNPSLQSRVPEAIVSAYEDARRDASSEMDVDLDALPDECPYSWNEIMARPFEWPKA